MAKAVVMVFKIPTDVRASHNVAALTSKTASREISNSPRGVIFSGISLFRKSSVTMVEHPRSNPTAVDISAAHKDASNNPPTAGVMWVTRVGSAMAAFSRPGNWAAAIIPKSAHKNPAGMVIIPPIIKPRRAVRPFLAAKAI